MTIYKPLIHEIPNIDNIFDSDSNIIFSDCESLPLLSLGYHYFIKQTREKMNDDKIRNGTFFLVTNEFESKIKDYDNDIDNYTKKKYKLKEISNRFYEMWEIMLYFELNKGKTLNCLQIGGDNLLSESIKLNRNNKSDKFILDITKMKNEADLILFDIILEKSNNMEQQIYKELLEGIIKGIKHQKKGGNFILRIYDTFTEFTIRIICILKSIYNKVFICKPIINKSFLSSKFIICKKFESKNNKNTITKLNSILNEINRNKTKKILNIFKNYKLNSKLINLITIINLNLINNEYKSINEIIRYKDSENYYGEQYHKYRDEQIKNNKWWIKTFYESENYKKIIG